MRRSRPRSTSVESGRSWGSYRPSARRSTSESRISGGVANVLQRGMSPACGGKTSLGGLCFRKGGGSSVEGRRLIKDPRPLTDKAYQSKCIATLAEYLIENNFPYPMDSKRLLSPSKKDFEKIFEFLYRCWEPRYTVGKIEDEAPKNLKLLSYPFILTKSTFLSVNRMTWPTLLGILMWLLDLNKFYSSIRISSFFQSDFENGEEQFQLVNYILEDYASNVDDQEKDYQFFSSLLAKRCPVDASVEELENSLRTEERRLAELRKKLDTLNEIEKENEILASNVKKYKNFLPQMKKHSELKAQECLELGKEIQKKELELEQLMEAAEEKEKAYNEQGYDGLQKQQFLLAQKQMLSKDLEEKRDCFLKEEKMSWDLQIQDSTMRNKIVEKNKEFNEKYASLPSVLKDAISPLKNVEIPAAIKLYNDFAVTLPEFELSQNDIIEDYAALKNKIQPALDNLKDYLINQKECLTKILALQNNWIHDLEMKLSELNIKVDVVKAQTVQKQRERVSNAKKMEEEIARLKQETEAGVAKMDKRQKYIAQLENLIASLKQQIKLDNKNLEDARVMQELYRKKATTMFEEMQEEVRETKAKYDRIKQLFKQELENFAELVQNKKREKRVK